MNKTIPLVEGIDLLGLDLEGVNDFLKTPPANGAGMALLVSGDLSPGNANVSIVQGEPIGGIVVTNANESGNQGSPLKLAAIVRMSPHYDHRHSGYLQRRLVREIAEKRGMTPRDDVTKQQLEINDVPAGDLQRMAEAGDRLIQEIDDAIGFEIFGGPSAPQA